MSISAATAEVIMKTAVEPNSGITLSRAKLRTAIVSCTISDWQVAEMTFSRFRSFMEKVSGKKVGIAFFSFFYSKELVKPWFKAFFV